MNKSDTAAVVGILLVTLLVAIYLMGKWYSDGLYLR